MKRLAVLAMLGAVACASWRSTSEQATPLEQAQAACKPFAARDSAEGLEAKMAVAAFAECMRGHGRVQTVGFRQSAAQPKEPTTSTVS